MNKTVLVFGLLILALLILFQFSKYSIISGNLNTEIVLAIIAIVFLVVGIFIHKKSLHQQTKITPEVDHHKIQELEISTREYEVLKEIASGLSNKEIADKLFVSESTIKTHVSNLLMKLNAKRRTQAVQIAQQLNIL